MKTTFILVSWLRWAKKKSLCSKRGTKASKWRIKLPIFCTKRTLRAFSTKMYIWNSWRHSIANRRNWEILRLTAPQNSKRNFHRRLLASKTSNSRTILRRQCWILSAKNGTCSSKSLNQTLTRTNTELGCSSLEAVLDKLRCSDLTNICSITKLWQLSQEHALFFWVAKSSNRRWKLLTHKLWKVLWNRWQIVMPFRPSQKTLLGKLWQRPAFVQSIRAGPLKVPQKRKKFTLSPKEVSNLLSDLKRKKDCKRGKRVWIWSSFWVELRGLFLFKTDKMCLKKSSTNQRHT